MAAMAAVSSSVSPSKAPVLPSPARFQTTFAKTSFGKEARQVVLNVYYKLRCESPNESYKAIVQRTSELTRVGYSTIFRWKKLVQSSPDGTPSVPSPKRKRKRSAPPTPSLLDSFDRGTLRLIVHDCFRRNECPTLSKVLEVARDNDKFPKISRTTLWRALVDLGFTFVKRNRDSLLMERTDLKKRPELKELQVKRRRCFVLHPNKAEVRLKLHWLPSEVAEDIVRKAFDPFGRVEGVERESWHEEGLSGVESTTRRVRLTLRDGVTTDRLPHQLRILNTNALVIVLGRTPMGLRCRKTGHVRRDCRVPLCDSCRRFGHLTEV
ncbi:hypothetical protein HPB47_002011 [Ixodes persulcatus]|uniref:Uncharacterized protein n=1 Tax=Ixodes persulcatus TaxID=34615 RepID=A0AC60PMD8_IXOPE|nr:hypothetical protein HPB47_002011 [Ixodes persulcatus]